MNYTAGEKISVILMNIGILLIGVGVAFGKVFVFTGITMIVVGIIMFLLISTKSYSWTCCECDTKFKISVMQNIKSKVAGRDQKYLMCPKCKKATKCFGIKKK